MRMSRPAVSVALAAVTLLGGASAVQAAPPAASALASVSPFAEARCQYEVTVKTVYRRDPGGLANVVGYAYVGDRFRASVATNGYLKVADKKYIKGSEVKKLPGECLT
ncbi:hypothetical protein ACFVT5_01690 [Streptomyces sp. NPDC058001]|uniref:hypothetical protein n=1 Tax=Streptomyces sp. NPDC058001 TaxID=3346300 RepID=UPI0036E7BF79